MSGDLICTYEDQPPLPPRSCREVGVEFCIDCLRGTDPTDMSAGLANDCTEGESEPPHPCPDCMCGANTHQEGFVACGPDHKAAQMAQALGP